MKRVLIIGCPGSGKTTFARQLSMKIKLPVIHLDFFYHDSNYDYDSNKVAWDTYIHKATQESEWIMDGNYNRTMALRMERADTIFLFDLPGLVPLWRVVKRRIMLHGKERPDMPKDWQEKFNLKFFKMVLSFNRQYRPSIRDLLDKQDGKTIILFNHSNESTRYLESLDRL